MNARERNTGPAHTTRIVTKHTPAKFDSMHLLIRARHDGPEGEDKRPERISLYAKFFEFSRAIA